MAPVGSVVSDANPRRCQAKLWRSISPYFGAVSPAISDGAAGPSGPLSYATNTIGVSFSGTNGTNDFAGLAPTYWGLYQLNVTVPAGLTAGPNFASSLLGVGCVESHEVLTDDGEHGERGAGRSPAPLTPALAWRSSRIPAELILQPATRL